MSSLRHGRRFPESRAEGPQLIPVGERRYSPKGMRRAHMRGHSLAFGLVVCLAIVLAGCGLPGAIASTGKLPSASTQPTPAALPPVRFPQDEAPHHDLTEWWYYTGHLHGTDAQGH